MAGPDRIIGPHDDYTATLYEWHPAGEYVECEIVGNRLEWMRRAPDGIYTHHHIEIDLDMVPAADAALRRMDARAGEDAEAWARRLATTVAGAGD